MTMTDGWVGERISRDPTDSAALQAAMGAIETAKPASSTARAMADRKSAGSGAGTWSARLLVAGVLIGGGVVGWPYVADMLATEPVVATAPQGPPTQRLVLNGDNMYLEGTVPDDEASQQFEDVAAAIVGADRVVNNFSISSDAVFDPDQAVQLAVADTVLFSTGRADISEQYEPLINLAVEILQARELVTIVVIGHTDDIGEEDTNLGLSVARADATKAQIVARGIAPERITTEGRGESEPLASNDTEEGRQTNRRVEFLVTGMLR